MSEPYLRLVDPVAPPELPDNRYVGHPKASLRFVRLKSGEIEDRATGRTFIVMTDAQTQRDVVASLNYVDENLEHFTELAGWR